MSRVSNALPQHVLTDTNRVTDGQNVGTLNDRQVRPGLGQRIKRAVSNFFSDIGTTFRALKDRVATAYHNQVLKHNTASANLAANKLATALARGKSDDSIASAMMSLIQKAGRLDRNDPDGKAKQLLHSAIGNLSPEDKASLCDKTRDWDSLGTRLKTEVDNRFVRMENLCGGLAEMHGEHQPDHQEFLDEANSYKDSIDEIISGLKVEASIGRGELLLAKLPDGMTMDQQGFVGGTITLTTTPPDCVLQPEQRGVTVNEALSFTINETLAPKTYTTHPDKFHGVDVPTQSSKDLYRLDLRIAKSNGTYQSRNDPEKRQDERNKNIVSELKQLAGNDTQTTRVLAGALTQSVLRVFHESLTTPDGKAVNLKFGNRNKIPDAKIQTPNGLVSFGGVSNYGGAVWNVSKLPNGDFKVVVDWPMYPVGTGTSDDGRDMRDPLPFPNGANVLKSDFHVEYVIDANAARNGQLQLSMPTPPTVTFSGGLEI